MLFVSQLDNIIFTIADMGYFGRNLAEKTAEVKAVGEASINSNARTRTGVCFLSRFCGRMKRTFDLHACIFGVLCVMMIGGISSPSRHNRLVNGIARQRKVSIWF